MDSGRRRTGLGSRGHARAAPFGALTERYDTHVRPRPLIGVLIGIGYAVFFLVVQLIMGVDYDEIGDTLTNVVKGILIPVGLGAVLIAVVATLLGWWRPALFEQAVGPKWRWLVPALMIVSIAISLATSDWGIQSVGFITVLLIGTMLVGFSEEMVFRGLTLVGLRGGLSEVWVWFGTSALFGLVHGVNAFTGQGFAPTVQQIVFAFVFGSVFYVIRRVSGTLILCMVLHGFWDFSTFLRSGDDVSGTALLGGAAAQWFAYAAVVVAIVILVKLLRDERRHRGTAPAPAGA